MNDPYGPMRCLRLGFILLAMHDPEGRRGVWGRVRGNTAEFCAGRDGDDATVVFENLTPEQVKGIKAVLEHGAAQVEAAGFFSGREKLPKKGS